MTEASFEAEQMLKRLQAEVRELQRMDKEQNVELGFLKHQQTQRIMRMEELQGKLETNRFEPPANTLFFFIF